MTGGRVLGRVYKEDGEVSDSCFQLFTFDRGLRFQEELSSMAENLAAERTAPSLAPHVLR